MSTVLDANGNQVSLRGNIMFSNPQSDVLISGPNEDFLKAIHDAFKMDACFVRYGAQIPRTYKRFIIFVVQGLPKEGENELINWISYLRMHQEPKNDKEFILI